MSCLSAQRVGSPLAHSPARSLWLIAFEARITPCLIALKAQMMLLVRARALSADIRRDVSDQRSALIGLGLRRRSRIDERTLNAQRMDCRF